MINANQKSLENQLRAWDQKLVKLRNEIDFNGINKKINSFATQKYLDTLILGIDSAQIKAQAQINDVVEQNQQLNNTIIDLQNKFELLF